MGVAITEGRHQDYWAIGLLDSLKMEKNYIGRSDY